VRDHFDLDCPVTIEPGINWTLNRNPFPVPFSEWRNGPKFGILCGAVDLVSKALHNNGKTKRDGMVNFSTTVLIWNTSSFPIYGTTRSVQNNLTRPLSFLVASNQASEADVIVSWARIVFTRISELLSKACHRWHVIFCARGYKYLGSTALLYV